MSAVRCCWRAVLLAALLACGGAAAQDGSESVLERRVKAALLYRFVNYVEWPAPASSPAGAAPFVIGVVGAEVLAAELAEFANGRRVLDRPLVVRALQSLQGIRAAHIVFVAASASPRLASIAQAASPSALIVTETQDGMRPESVINFLVVDGRVRFEVSLDAAHGRDLRLSSRLLSVAYRVRGAY